MKTKTKPNLPKPDFTKPTEVDGISIAFGGDMALLLPAYESIPEEFKDHNCPTPWNKIMMQWFFQGLPDGTRFVGKDGIDPKAAMRHISAILASLEPKHEHKEAGVAYLMSLWFEQIDIPKQ